MIESLTQRIHAHSAHNDPEATTGTVKDIFEEVESTRRNLNEDFDGQAPAADEPASEAVMDDQGMLL